MPNIFMIHSRYDTALPTFFDKAASMVGISLVHMEWEELVPPPWKHIREKLETAEALFIFKGPNIARNLYTSNWVSYEIGLAAHPSKKSGKEMDVWVFESVQNPVFFPVPFLTNYVLYDSSEPYHTQYLRSILEGYNYSTYRHLPPKGHPVTCWHDDCKVEYSFHTIAKTWNCPSCQRQTAWTWTEEVDYPEDALKIRNENFGRPYLNVNDDLTIDQQHS